MTYNTHIHQDGTYASLIPSTSSKEKLYAFCASLDVPNLVDQDDYHCTLVYSTTPCPAIAKEDFGLPIEAIMRGFKILGDESKVLVIELYCPAAKSLHKHFRKAHDAHHDYDDYIPHITVAKDFKGELPSSIFEDDLLFTGMTVEELS
jgi:hypothetical protein